MTTRTLSAEDYVNLEQIAYGWGKIVLREAYPDGVPLNVSLAEMEEVARRVSQAVTAGTLLALLDGQAVELGAECSCPGCGRLCPKTVQTRPLQVVGAKVEWEEPTCHCPVCRRDFFPSADRFAAGHARVQLRSAGPDAVRRRRKQIAQGGGADAQEAGRD